MSAVDDAMRRQQRSTAQDDERRTAAIDKVTRRLPTLYAALESNGFPRYKNAPHEAKRVTWRNIQTWAWLVPASHLEQNPVKFVGFVVDERTSQAKAVQTGEVRPAHVVDVNFDQMGVEVIYSISGLLDVLLVAPKRPSWDIDALPPYND